MEDRAGDEGALIGAGCGGGWGGCVGVDGEGQLSGVGGQFDGDGFAAAGAHRGQHGGPELVWVAGGVGGVDGREH